MPCPDRELWQPNPEEMRAACEILLASSIPSEARKVVRDLEADLSRRTHEHELERAA